MLAVRVASLSIVIQRSSSARTGVRMFASANTAMPLKQLGNDDGNGGDGIVLVPEDGSYDNVVIMMHGLGDTAYGWAPAMPALKLPRVKYVLPTAPTRPIALNGGMAMPGWFDIYGLEPSSPEDKEGFDEASARIEALIEIEEEHHGIPSSRVAVCGFSQGGAVALHVALRYAKPLAACVSMSSWLPLRDDYPRAFSEHAKGLPVLQCHGDADPVVPWAWGRGSYDLLMGDELALSTVTWRDYPGMQHSACNEEIDDVAEFLSQHFSSH